MSIDKQRAWAEIDLGAIVHNYRVICQQAHSPVLCVVKANAYGHGAVQVANRLQEIGAPYFAVATIPEAVELREHGITTPILILGYVAKEEMEMAARQHITVPVYDIETARLLSNAAQRTGETITVHYKLDTGMTRLGFPSWDKERTVQDILACASMPGLYSEGIFTHFAIADVPDGASYTAMQYNRFHTVCEALQSAGLSLPLRHCANSAGIQSYTETHETMTRAGIILYGYRPDVSVPYQLPLRPAMTIKARIAQVRDLPAETAIGYGCTFKTSQPIRIAVLTMGYADGFLRTGSGKACVLLNGIKTPILGRVCMDMCMALVPEGVSVKRDDKAVIFGASGWTAEDVAQAAGTISYEVLCAVSSRVLRFYE